MVKRLGDSPLGKKGKERPSGMNLVRDQLMRTRELRSLLGNNPGIIEEGLIVLKQEYPTEIGPIDMLCIDNEGRLCVVELNLDQEDDMLLQALRNYDWVYSNRGRISEIFKDRKIDGSKDPKITLIARDFSETLIKNAKYVSPRIDIYSYKYLQSSQTAEKSLLLIPKKVEEPKAPPRPPPTPLRALVGVKKLVSTVLIASLIVAVGLKIYIASAPQTGESFTEFYILDPSGKADGYPTNLTLGESGTLILGIINHEYEEVSYRIVIKLNTETIATIENIILSNNAKWEQNYIFTPRITGENMKLVFLLYRDDVNETYRSLNLWITVNP